jgi:hypothetical protein
LSAEELKKEEAQGSSVDVGTGIEIKEDGLLNDEIRMGFSQNKKSIGSIATEEIISFVSEISLIGGTSTEENGD